MHSRLSTPAVPTGFRSDLPRWRQLVCADWLADWLQGQPVVAAPAGHWQLFEVGCEVQAAFAGGHIPGARYLDTQQFEQAPFWNTVADAALLDLLQTLRLGPDSSVILYGRNMLAAARVAQLMLYAGVRDVRLLDGGLAAWCAAGHGLDSCAVQATANRSASCSGPTPSPWRQGGVAHPGYLLNLAQARALLQQERAALVSIRSHAEWMGQTSGYPYIAARGEIEGALWGHAGQDGDVNSMRSFQDAQGRMKPAAEIEALWAQAGIRRGMQIAFYCGTGWRASLAFFYAWLMGWERISVFDGGWMEWSADAANPVAVFATAPSMLQEWPILQFPHYTDIRPPDAQAPPASPSNLQL